MATNKNAVLRYNILDHCFSNFYKKYFIEDLIAVCGEKLTEHFGFEVTVSRRTILEDIKFMKSAAGYDAPIISIADGKKVYYRYEEDDYSILKKPLTEKEKQALSEVLNSISRIKNLPGLGGGMDTVQTKIYSVLDITKDERKIISFQENEFLVGVENLSPLYQHISHKNTLKIEYRSFRSDKNIFILLSPQFLKQYNNRWFLFGENHEKEVIQNLALDRIKSITITKEPYREAKIDYDEYFDDIIGVTDIVTNKPITVKIEVSEESLPYIKTKPLHGSQKITGNILTLHVKHNYELETLLLSYGERIKVLEPENLVEALKERIKKQFALYFK